MAKYSKFNLVYHLQKWMDSVPGQTFLNYAYSWGASIVILGTLFKLTHLPYANIMLFIGMGTEVFVFLLSAFDRPFDKTAIGKVLPTHVYSDNEVHATPSVTGENVTNGDNAGNAEYSGESVSGGYAGGGGYSGGGGYAGGGGVVITGGGVTGSDGTGEASAFTGGTGGAGGVTIIGGGGSMGGTMGGYDDTPQNIESEEFEYEPGGPAEETSSGAHGISGQTPVIPQEWLDQQQQVSPEMEEATVGYVDALKNLTEMLQKVSEQSEKLATNSEEMENLNRTLTGICKVYEMQLKGASQQVGTIDQINDQTRKMAQQIDQLNQIYARMIEAMTVNVRMSAAATGADTTITTANQQ
ncbi:MAG: gliding motility protein GldL [Prevotella sp.]|nr:gliding motility protein GldL [Prevotella sp.]